MAIYNLQLEGAERDALLQLLDMAVKAHGLKITEATLHFAKKIANAPEFVQATEVKSNDETGAPTA